MILVLGCSGLREGTLPSTFSKVQTEARRRVKETVSESRAQEKESKLQQGRIVDEDDKGPDTESLCLLKLSLRAWEAHLAQDDLSRGYEHSTFSGQPREK